MVDLNAHEAGNGGQSQGKPTACGVLLYSEGYDRIARAGQPGLSHFRPDCGQHPAPTRHRTGSQAGATSTWKEFIRRHMDVLAGTDFFTVEVLTWRGLRTYYVLFFLHLETRRVSLAGITRHP